MANPQLQTFTAALWCEPSALHEWILDANLTMGSCGMHGGGHFSDKSCQTCGKGQRTVGNSFRSTASNISFDQQLHHISVVFLGRQVQSCCSGIVRHAFVSPGFQ